MSQPPGKIQVDPLDIKGKTMDEQCALAIDAIAWNRFKANGHTWLSLREATKAYEVLYQHVTACFNGWQTRKEAHAHQSHLTPAVDKALVDWIKEMGHHGIPLHPSMVALHANTISGAHIGEHWVAWFHRCHPDLKAKWMTRLKKCCTQALNKPAVDDYFEMLEELIEKYKIKKHNIYNMDEKGIQLGVGGRVRAIVDHNQKTVHQVEDSNRELVTFIECAAADGSMLPPTVVFKGLHQNLEWGWQNPCNAR